MPGVPYHVTQRGNRQEQVFFSDEDRQEYLRLLRSYSMQHGLDVLAYCLMPNHVHLVAVPRDEKALAGALKPVHARYVQHFNWTQGLTGRLWQGRFFSCSLDDLHLCRAIRYVERNPVRAGLVKRATDHAWSSASAHCGMRWDPILSDVSTRMNIADWGAWLDEAQDPLEVEMLRKHTRTGRPLGDDAFLDLLETILNHSVRPGKPGRRKKKYGDAALISNGSVPRNPRSAGK